jgi:hypothetical protein
MTLLLYHKNRAFLVQVCGLLLPTPDRRKDAHLISVVEHVAPLLRDAVDKDDLDLGGWQTQTLDQLFHRRSVWQFYRHSLADSQVWMVATECGEQSHVYDHIYSSTSF